MERAPSLCWRKEVREATQEGSAGWSGLRRLREEKERVRARGYGEEERRRRGGGERYPQSMLATLREHWRVSLWSVEALALTNDSRHCKPSASNTAFASRRHSSSSTFTDCSDTSLHQRAAKFSPVSASGCALTWHGVQRVFVEWMVREKRSCARAAAKG